MAASKVSLKLLIDTKENRVLFAEAGRDFVDFLFSILSLPIGTVTRLLTKECMVGSLGNLYDSLETLNEQYIQPNQHKDTFLKPKSPISSQQFPLLSLNDTDSPAPAADQRFYGCGNCRSFLYVAEDSSAVCPSCRNRMSAKVTYVVPPAAAAAAAAAGGEEGGFVKGVVTYMVMDDLAVKPLSTISSITLLNKFNVKEVGVLEEKVVHLGVDEGLKLLKASLDSKKVLTRVFLGKTEA